MAESSLTPPVRARKIASTVLQRVSRDGTQVAVAAAMGVSESTVSRLLSDHLDKLALVLAHAGLKVVPNEMRCFPEDRMAAILLLAKERLETVTNIDQLQWDE